MTELDSFRDYVCGVELAKGKHCQNRVKPGKGPCWRHANGLSGKVRSFAQNETKKFILGTALSIVGCVGAFYGGSRINIARTSGPNSPAVNGSGTVINYGGSQLRPWVAIKDPALVNTVELSDRGFDAWVRLTLENTSDTPAVASRGASLFFMTDPRPKAGIEKAQDDLCKSIRGQMESQNTLTVTLFRGTEQYPTTASVHANRNEVDEAIRRTTLNFAPPGGEPEVGPIVISCVVYRPTGGTDYYESAYANNIFRLICKNARDTVCSTGFMSAKKRKYSATELAFPPSFESGIRAK